MYLNLLVFNCGSSSLAYKLYRAEGDSALSVTAAGKAYHVGTVTQEAAYLRHSLGAETVTDVRPLPDHRTAAAGVLAHLREHSVTLDAIGHRFVHGGARFRAPVVVTGEIMPELKACNRLAPIHNPNSLSVIDLCRAELPQVMQYAVFDTTFHAALPEAAYRYALPLDLADRYGFRKFGFHGLSYEYVTHETARVLHRPIETLKIIACHLGTGGSSVAAIDGGRSVETSMGYSPLPGLIMSTRSGDIDPAIVLALIAEHGHTAEAVDGLLNRASGLLGISGTSSDLFELIRLADEAEDPRARLAVAMYVHRLRSYIGAYAAVLGGFDVLAFTDDIGVRAWQVRESACANLAWCGVILDAEANRRAPADAVTAVSAVGSRVTVLSIPTNEEIVIARGGLRLLTQ